MDKPLKIGVFGGTFNPFHNGHKILLQKAQNRLFLDKIIIIPAKLPPHKTCNDLVCEADRLKMCQLSISNEKNWEVSDMEYKRAGKSYSIDTINELKTIYPDSTLYFIMGSDMFLTFKTWYKFDDILKKATIVTMSREQDVLKKLIDFSKELKEIGGEAIILNEDFLEVSSSQIREKIKNGLDYKELIDKKVLDYINENKLYR